MKLPVWIDCDPGIDDAGAILMAHSLDALEIVGISTVAGNAPLDVTTKNALKLGDLSGAAYPVYAGASKPLFKPYEDGAEFHGADGFGGAALPESARCAQKETAWDGLYAAAKQYPGELELVTMGPLTNVAIALEKYPALPTLLKRILIMGGSITRGNCTPCAEYNIYTDPEAAQVVFRSGVPVVMCGLEVTEQAYLLPGEWEEIGRMDSEKARFFHKAAAHILQKNLENGHEGFCIHDACPVFCLAHPECFAGEECGVFVETQSELTLGKTVCDLYSDKQFDVKNTLVLLNIDRPAFIQALFEALK